MPGRWATDPADLQAHARAQLPDIPFEKRIQLLQAFNADTGTLDIDHNYALLQPWRLGCRNYGAVCRLEVEGDAAVAGQHCHVPDERQSVLLHDPPQGGVPFHDDEGSYGSVKSADRRHVHRQRLRSLVVRLPVDRYKDIIGHQGLTRVMDKFP